MPTSVKKQHGQPPRIWSTVFLLLPLIYPSALAAQPTLDELLELEPAEPAQTAPEDKDDPTADTDDEQADLKKKLAEMREQAAMDYKEAANAFEEAIRQMDEVSIRLSQSHDPSVKTQRIQEQILKKLDQMIAAAEQQQHQQQSSSNSSSKPQDGDHRSHQSSQSSSLSQPSGARPNQGEASPGSVAGATDSQQPLEELRQEWGNLPPRLREELSEGLGERFSPVYRLMTEAYYRRLAEEAGGQ